MAVTYSNAGFALSELEEKRVKLRGKDVLVRGFPTDSYFGLLEHHAGQMEFFNACLDSAPGTMFDIGANIGVTACAAHDRPVYAFEPSPRAHSALVVNTAARPDVVVINKAVGSAPGELRFAETAMLAGSHVDPDGAVRVEVTRLDDWRQSLAIDKPAVVKIDVEGHEQHVLDGGVETLTGANAPLVLLEVNPWTLDAFGGIATSVFLSGIVERFGGFIYPKGDKLIEARDKIGVLTLTYALLTPGDPTWLDIAFSSSPARIEALKATWATRPR